MRFFSFHYMTYTGMDAEQAFNEHGVSWCTMPNSLCDREVMAQDYRNFVDQAAYADVLNFDGVAVNEHHQTPFGTMPSPNVMAAAIAQRTERCRIAVFGNALPLRMSPMISIEEYSMIDLLSNGRLEAGFVVGGGPEYYSFALPPTDARDKFAEALALARKAWSVPGPFRWDGKYYQFDIVNPWPLPLQTPHPPVWVCGVGSPSTLEMCARENLGYMGVNTMTGHRDFIGQCEYFRDAAVKYGREYDPNKMGWLTFVHVADTDEQAVEEFVEYSKHASYLTRGFGGPTKTFFPPGHLPPDKLAAWERDVRANLSGHGVAATTQDLPLFGTPETVAQRLIDKLKDYKIGNVVTSFQWGTMPHEVALKSMKRFAEEVIPIVRRELDDYLDELYPNRTQNNVAQGVPS